MPFDKSSGGIDGRERGLGQISKSNSAWLRAALSEVYQLPEGWSGIAEELKPLVIPSAGEPTKPNAWGALTMHAIRLRWLQPTGSYTKMRKASSHARKSEIHMRTNW